MNNNFTIKITLEEANTTKRALEFYKNTLIDELTEDTPQEDRQELGRIDTLLRRDFS